MDEGRRQGPSAATTTHFDSVKPVSASITATWLSAATATRARLGVPAGRLFVRAAKPSWRSLQMPTAPHAEQGRARSAEPRNHAFGPHLPTIDRGVVEKLNRHRLQHDWARHAVQHTHVCREASMAEVEGH